VYRSLVRPPGIAPVEHDTSSALTSTRTVRFASCTGGDSMLRNCSSTLCSGACPELVHSVVKDTDRDDELKPRLKGSSGWVDTSTGCEGARSDWTIAGRIVPLLHAGQIATRPARCRIEVRPDSCRLAPGTVGSHALGNSALSASPPAGSPKISRMLASSMTSACRSSSEAFGSLTSK